MSRYVLELANMPPNRYQPFVGRSAFAHKGGVHISAVERNPLTYEHIDPELVGNRRRILVSDLSGRATIKRKAEDYGLNLSKTDPVAMQVLEELKDLENQGFQFEAAEASFELLINKAMGKSKRYFELVGFRVIDQKMREDQHAGCRGHHPGQGGRQRGAHGRPGKRSGQRPGQRPAQSPREILPGTEGHGAERLQGPGAARAGTARRRGFACSSNPATATDQWGTVGVSHDIIEASWQALVDSINYKMYKSEKQQGKC